MADTVTIMAAFTDTSDENFELFRRTVMARRSNLLIDTEKDVDESICIELIRLAACAPNHKRTFPWKFRVIKGDGRAALGQALAADLIDNGEPEAKIEKARKKYLRAPVVIAVASTIGDDEIMTAENRDAVSAAIQTLLLGATAKGLASYWSTGGAMLSARVRDFCQFDPTDTMIGLLYLGWPHGNPPAIERPEPDCRLLDTGI